MHYHFVGTHYHFVGTHYHFVGIGGIGLSAIAKVLLEQGHQVSGSDLKLSPRALALAELGAVVYEGHDAAHLKKPDVVVLSSAVPLDNPEVVAARQQGIPVIKRDRLLGEMMSKMMSDKVSVAVAGTHGKTTTCSLIAHTLTELDQDPTFIVGGVLGNLGTNARAGGGPHFVIEADEYDHAFLGLCPQVAVVTHLEHDHPDCFATVEDVEDAFRQFVALVPSDGCIIGCGDAPRVARLLQELQARPGAPEIWTYGLTTGLNWRAVGVAANDMGGHDMEVLQAETSRGRFRLPIPGIHNVKNALAAVAVAYWLGLDLQQVANAMATFRTTARRFELKGIVAGVTVIDDYAHHPTEIQATLAAAREQFPDRTIWAVFQPHTFSRTRALMDDFVTSFDKADHVIVLDIYPAREVAADFADITAAGLTARLMHPEKRHISTHGKAVTCLLRELQPGDVLLTLGAGDGYLIGERVLAQWKAKA
jgi:UDP-N-acetylmuramate--alanine ligase